jgi:phage gp16-like protein
VNNIRKKVSNRSRLIQLIHVGKSQLLMAEDSYRALLAYHAGGKKSSSTLTDLELQAVLDNMVKLGFKVKPNTPKQADKKRSPKTPDQGADERSVIRAIWIFMFNAGFIRDGSETALNRWVQRQTAELNNGAGISSVEWLTPGSALMVLESLKKWCRRLMFSALQKNGHSVFPQMSYNQLLAKWNKVHGADA